jgi:hypothetical protein
MRAGRCVEGRLWEASGRGEALNSPDADYLRERRDLEARDGLTEELPDRRNLQPFRDLSANCNREVFARHISDASAADFLFQGRYLGFDALQLASTAPSMSAICSVERLSYLDMVRLASA